MPLRRPVSLGGVDIDNLTLVEAVQAIRVLAESGGHHLVVTPNVDHLVLLRRDGALRAAYERASLRLADGAPLIALSRLLRTPLPQRVAGADLLEPICAAVALRNLSVYLLGGKPGAADAAAVRLAQKHPGLRVAAQCPHPRFENDPDATKAVLDDISREAPNVLIVCLGAPKQEKWIAEHLDKLPPVVAVCAGAALDFFSGTTRRAPLVWQRLGFEWLHRLLQEPRRLGPRYLGRDWAFIGIAARDLWSSRRSRTAGRRRSAS